MKLKDIILYMIFLLNLKKKIRSYIEIKKLSYYSSKAELKNFMLGRRKKFIRYKEGKNL